MGHMLAAMEKSAGKGVRIAYMVVAILFALMMFFSASFKLTNNPDAVHLIHEVIGIPLALIPVLALCEIAGGLGLLAGILRPKLGVAAAAGLVLYFVGAMVAHMIAGDWAGLKAPFTPLVISGVALALALKRMRQGLTA